MTRLYRSESDRILGGVCGGIAEIYGLDPSLVRLAAVLIGFTAVGSPVLLYLILWIVIPSESEIQKEIPEPEGDEVELEDKV